MSTLLRLGRLSSGLALLIFAALSPQALAGPYYDQLMRDYRLEKKDHSFCFINSQQEIEGDNAYQKVRLASTSKLITTLWAMDLLGPEWKYETKFYLKGNHLHIEGSLDPLFSKRKLFYFVSQLVNKKIQRLERITFNADFRAFAAAEDYVGTLVSVDGERSARNLYDYWQVPAYNKLIPVYKNFIATTPLDLLQELQIRRNLSELDLSVGTVQMTAEAPFDLEGSDVEEFHHFSPEIRKYLKFMNIESNNFIADQVFEKLGGEEAFDLWLEDFMGARLQAHDKKRSGFGPHEKSFKMYTGSGLDTKRNSERVDNYATCALMVTLMSELDHKLTESDHHLKEVVAVTGSDGGTFASRLRSQITRNAVVAKTGTLFHTSTLMGLIYAKGGKYPFGIFHQLTGGKGNAKIVQNKLVEKLIEDLGGAHRFDYAPEFFFPADAPLE